MKTGITSKMGRMGISIAATAAIVGASLAGIAANSGQADAALKWREEAVKWTVKAEKCKDKDTTCTTTTDATATP
jgi:hypothetical protein